MSVPTEPPRRLVDDTPVPIEAREEWHQDRHRIGAPSEMMCPGSGCYETMTIYWVAVDESDPVTYPAVWLLQCPLEGTFYEYRDLA